MPIDTHNQFLPLTLERALIPILNHHHLPSSNKVVPNAANLNEFLCMMLPNMFDSRGQGSTFDFANIAFVETAGVLLIFCFGSGSDSSTTTAIGFARKTQPDPT